MLRCSLSNHSLCLTSLVEGFGHVNHAWVNRNMGSSCFSSLHSIHFLSIHHICINISNSLLGVHSLGVHSFNTHILTRAFVQLMIPSQFDRFSGPTATVIKDEHEHTHEKYHIIAIPLSKLRRAASFQPPYLTTDLIHILHMYTSD